jgi:hypothetical protein
MKRSAFFIVALVALVALSGFASATQPYWDASTRMTCLPITDNCYGAHRVSVGTAHGKVQVGSPIFSAGASTWFDPNSGACGGNGGFIGFVSKTKDLIVFLEGVRAFDSSFYDAAEIEVWLSVQERSAFGCAGPDGAFNDMDIATIDTSTFDLVGQALAYCDERADCAGMQGGGCDSWHLPSVRIPHPVSNGYKTYSIGVLIWACSIDDPNDCAQQSTSGCLAVSWND